MGYNRRPVLVVILLALVVILWIALMIAYYRFPGFFEIENSKKKSGLALTETLIHIGDEMMGAWLPNDTVYPTILLDNPQNFQLGQLEALRYSVRVLRDNLSRLRTTDKIDENVDKAYILFSNDPRKWIFPSAESKYRAGVQELRIYQDRLEKGNADFFPRADNLVELLAQLNSLLGGVNTRLANAPRDQGPVLTEETAGDPYIQGEKVVMIQVPWDTVDDNFYYARGVAYGIRQILLAIRYDFEEILEIKKAKELLERIIRLLDQSQFEPILVLNGSRGSIWANHSLQMLATLGDVRQKISSLASMLRE
jgi:hypothetical protein